MLTEQRTNQLLAELRNMLTDDSFLKLADLALEKEALPFYRELIANWPHVVGYKLVAEHENKAKEALRTGATFNTSVYSMIAFERCRAIQLALVYMFNYRRT